MPGIVAEEGVFQETCHRTPRVTKFVSVTAAERLARTSASSLSNAFPLPPTIRFTGPAALEQGSGAGIDTT